MKNRSKTLWRLSLPLLLGAAAVTCGPALGADVTQDRLNNADAEANNWLHVNGNYAAHRYSQLTQISKDNIGDLRLRMMVLLAGQVPAAGGTAASSRLEGTPIAEDGMLYVTDGWGAVYKIDTTSQRRADIVWKMDPQVDKVFAGDVACCGINNRGVGLWGDQVISVALDGRVFATNKDSGEVTWEHKAADPAIAETLTVAPLIVDGKAVYGQAGAEFGIRGWIEAVDIATGLPAWRTHTAGGNDRDPSEIAKTTWANDTWKTGGGSIWQTGTYDPDLHLMYWGTGNAGPDYDTAWRPGDNLYAASILAMNPDDGFIKWYFQFTPNDPYDYDEISENPIIDVEINGTNRKIVVHSGRNGFFYGFDRTTGEFMYGQAYPNVVTWTDGLDPKTGRPTAYNPETPVQAYNPGTVGRAGGMPGVYCPATTGGKNWEPSSYNPTLHLIYVPSAEGCTTRWVEAVKPPAGVYPADIVTARGGEQPWRSRFTGNGQVNAAITPPPMPLAATRRSLNTIDVTTGQVATKIMFDQKNYGMLSTHDLAWTGNQLGDLIAYDASTLEVVWEFNVGTPIMAPPMSYGIGDTQYIAVMAGGTSGAAQARTRPAAGFLTPSNYLFIFGL